MCQDCGTKVMMTYYIRAMAHVPQAPGKSRQYDMASSKTETTKYGESRQTTTALSLPAMLLIATLLPHIADDGRQSERETGDAQPRYP